MRFAAIYRVVLGLFVVIASTAFAQTPAEVTPLEEGKPLLRDLAVGQEHNYQIKLQAGQCARIEVEQRGFNVVLNLLAPDGKLIFWTDDEWNLQGTEQAFVIAPVSGEYKLLVGPKVDSDFVIQPGKYEVRLTDVRLATAQDQPLYQRQILYSDATGKIYEGRDEKEKAQGVAFAQEWLRTEHNGGEPNKRANLLWAIGWHYFYTSNLSAAAEHLQQAASLFRQSGKLKQLGNAMNLLAHTNRNLGDYRAAIKCEEEALACWRSLGSRTEEAYAMNFLADFHGALGDEQQTEEYYNLSLRLARELKNQILESSVLFSLGGWYSWLNDYEKSFAYVQQAYEVAQKTGNKMMEANLSVEMAEQLAIQRGYKSRTQLLERRDSLSPRIIELLERARTLYRESNSGHEADPLSTLAGWYGMNGDRRAADAAIERVMTLSLPGPPNFRSAMKLYVANAYDLMNESQKALELSEQAYREYVGDAYGTANIAVSLAIRLRRAGRLTEAREKLETALNIKESLRTKLNNQDHRTTVSSDIALVYEIYTGLLMQLHEQKPELQLHEQSFLATERARARSLLDLLNEARANIRSDVAPALLTRETTLQQKLNSLTPRPNDPRKEQSLAANKQAINDTLDELRKVRTQIRQANPRFAELTEPQPPSLREIQTQLLDADTMLLSYALGEKRSFVWAITPDSINAYELPAREELTKLTRRVYELMTTPQRLTKLSPAQQQQQLASAEKQYQSEADTLSQMLLAPVASQLGNKRLLIVAPEALQYLPFGAIPSPLRVSSSKFRAGTNNSKPETRNSKPLIADHEIISLPSVSVMMLLRQELAQRKAAPKAVAVLADPVFDANDSRVKTKSLVKAEVNSPSSTSSALARSLRSFDGREGLARLMLSRDEAEAIAAAVPENARLKALDFKASRAEAMNVELSQYRIVHFATHGLLNAERPELSGLVFSLVDEKGNAQDGFLRLHEIYNLKLPAELVVLSACQTGLGKDIKGEGMIGLTRGFMYAGAARVVASLWRVDDYATSVLMKKFYRGMLQEKLPAAAALRKAQLEMWQQKQWQSPFYWGGFVLQGEWR